MLGMAPIAPMQRDVRLHLDVPGGRPLSAYVLGLAFGFGWTPCIGPILRAILTAGAATSTWPRASCFFRSIPSVSAFPSFWARPSPTGSAAGVVMVLMGIAMVTGRLSALSYLLLEAFPGFGRIG